MNSSLRKQIFFTILLLIFSSILAAWLTFSELYSSKLSKLEAQHTLKLNQSTELLFRNLAHFKTFIQLIQIDKTFVSGLQKDQPIHDRTIAQVFYNIGEITSNILNLRWIDENGDEKIRVNFQNGIPRIATGIELQNKKSRYYFPEIMQLSSTEIFISPIDLNIEYGDIVRPFQPTIRIAIKTGFDKSIRVGALIINFDLGYLLNKIKNLSDANNMLEIVDTDGSWIINSDPTKQWGHDLDKNFLPAEKTNPELWGIITNAASNSSNNIADGLVSHRQLSLNASEDNTQNQIYFLVITPKKIMNSVFVNSLIPAIFVFIGVIISGLFLIKREVSARISTLKLSNALQTETKRLEAVNSELDRTLYKQRVLQNDLVESKKLSSLGITVAGIAHELNTPIGGSLLAITSQQDKLKKLSNAINEGLTKSSLDEFIEASLDTMNIANRNLTRAKEVITRFKRITTERKNSAFSEFSLKEMVTDLLLALKPKLKENHIDVSNEIPNDLILYSDQGVLSQVLENLINNCIAHAFKDCTKRFIHIRTLNTANEPVTIDILDNGNGIEEALIDSIFDPFVTSARSHGHTGLGLHLVHQLVTQELGGRIRCLRRPEGGSQFSVTLPAQKQPKAEAAETTL